MARVNVVMPKMGESVMEGTVLEWKKQVGDTIEQDETLLEVSTDKVDSEVPSPEAGRLAEILTEEGDTVDVGTPIAVIETDENADISEGGGDESPAVEESDAETTESGTSEEEEAAEVQRAPARSEDPPAASSPPAPSAGGGEGSRVEVVMPKMGESVMEGTVLEWKKQVGDEIEQDEALLEISTDKVDSDVPSPEAGTLLEILVQEGDTVEVGTPIAVIGSGEAVTSASEESSAPSVQEEVKSESEDASAPAAETVPSTESPGENGSIPRRDDSGNFYSPLVRSIAEKEGLSLTDLQSIEGSGTEGRVTKQDVMEFIERGAPAAAPEPAPTPAQPAAAPTPSDGNRVEVVRMDRMRQIIAEHMRRSKDTAAHVTSFTEVDVTGLVRHREKHKEEFQSREGIKLTYTPYFVLAAIEPLRAHPLLNSSVEGNEIHIKKDFNIGIAVAIGKKGLLVPVVRRAGQQNLTGLVHSMADLAERARNNQLLPDELQGGTFTLTNVGSLGSLMGTPIINQPQVAILSPGAIVKRPVVIEDPEMGDTIAIRQMMYVSLSYDHRIIDGAMAASFLRAYRDQLEGIGQDSPLL